MGINTVLAAHQTGNGAGQNPADYTNSQQTAADTTATPATPPPSGGAGITVSQAGLLRAIPYGVVIADLCLLYLVLGA